MTTFIKYILISSLLFVSCNKDDAPNESTFCAEDPLQEIEWLKNLVANETNTDSTNSSGLEIIKYEYQNNLAFSINNCIDNCSGALTRIFDCDQNLICEFGGITGVDTCADFFKDAKNTTILFSTGSSNSLNCEKSLVISEPFYNASKSTAVSNAEIKENCLYLTFTILSTQDRIKDVNLIDSGQVLESSPIQRKLKLVVKENLTLSTLIEVTTSFDLSKLTAWDNPDPIILNIDGYDTPLKYLRVPQCGDPNVNCVAKDQIKETQELEKYYANIKEMANSVSCTEASDWKITPLGSKACGGPKEYVAYHKTIDEADFISKVEALKKAEVAFNKKWGIISDCTVIGMPSTVQCVEGKPRLIP